MQVLVLTWQVIYAQTALLVSVEPQDNDCSFRCIDYLSTKYSQSNTKDSRYGYGSS